MRRGSVIVGIVLVLVVAEIVVAGAILSGTRDQDLTLRRLDTVRAFYAAEAGMNMAIRELMLGIDADGDGTVGGISDDGVDANDLAIGEAVVVVTVTVSDGETILRSTGRAGGARRAIRATLQ